jgi:hypothetical protein
MTVCDRCSCLETAAPGKQCSLCYWKPQGMHTGPELHVAFKITYVYSCVNKLCRTQAEVILNHQNLIVHGVGLEEAMHRKYKRFKLGGSQAYYFSAHYLRFRVVTLAKA